MAKKSELKTVLIIEDETDIRNFASRALELEGYHTLQAGNGDEGLKLMRCNQISLLLLDLKLPTIDGWTVLEQMKASPALSNIPVVVFTASAAVPQRDKALSMGAADYLVKPISASGLKEAIARTLSLNRRC